MLSTKLEQIIKEVYSQMLQDSHHSLVFNQRLPIYQAIRQSHPAIGKNAQS